MEHKEEVQEATRIAVIVPWDSPFIWTAPMFNMLNWERPDGCKVKFFMGVGWCPAARHNDGVAKAQEWGANLIMFNGGDHLCPKDILPRMLARIDEGWDIVQAMIPSRGVCWDGIPFHAISYKVVGPMEQIDPLLHAKRDSIQVLSYEDEPQETHISGTGNIMMKAQILDGLQKPYFEETIKKDGLYSRYAMMDSQFVYRCTVEGGARMFVDTTIELVHLDVFGIDKTYQGRFGDKANQRDWSPAKDLRRFV